MARRRDRVLFWVNIAGVAALALFAAMSLFFWTHPHYVPACASMTAKGRCIPVEPPE